VRSLINSATEKIKLPGLLGTLLRGFPNKIFDGAKSFLAKLLGGGEADLDSAYGGKSFWKGREVPNNGAMMFDRGGLLQPGVTQVLNMTGKPEPVFTADQWAKRGGDGGGGRQPLIGHLEIPMHGSDVTANDVADEILWALRRVEVAGSGKYAEVGV
jgi:hypothetical protein